MTEPSFNTLDFSKGIFVLASGGRDSSAMALSLADYVREKKIKADIRLLFGDTHLNRSKARQTIIKLEEATGFPLETVKYQGDRRVIDILEESFRMIPKAIELLQFGNKSYKTLFLCCDVLKKRPMGLYLKAQDSGRIIQLLGIKDGDLALHRKYRMNQLRDWNTYYRKHKKSGLLYYYPLRDCQETDIARVLMKHGFDRTVGSGCAVCPIFCVANWDKKDPETARRSKLMAKRLGIDLRAESQTGLMEFCE